MKKWQLDIVEDQLCNNENAPDEELLAYFMKEAKLSEKEANEALAFRGHFFTTPIPCFIRPAHCQHDHDEVGELIAGKWGEKDGDLACIKVPK